jgi:hypothetical protein
MGQRNPAGLALAVIFALALAGSGPVVADDLVVAVKARDAKEVLALLKAGADPTPWER